MQTNLTSLYARRKNASGSYLRELYVTSDRFKNERNWKKKKYADLRASLKRLYPGYNVIQVNLVFDFLPGYHEELFHKLSNVGLSDSMNGIRKCQR